MKNRSSKKPKAGQIYRKRKRRRKKTGIEMRTRFWREIGKKLDILRVR